LTWLADAGVPVHHLQRIAGHGSLTTTQRYLHPPPDCRRRGCVAIEAPDSVHRPSQASRRITVSVWDAHAEKHSSQACQDPVSGLRRPGVRASMAQPR
jgi:hypothetical protein